MPLVIGLSGRIGSGKGTAAEYLKKKYKADLVVFSDILNDILDRLHIPITRYSLQQLGKSLRSGMGRDVIVNAMKADLETSKSKVIVVDGVRFRNEAKMVKDVPNSALIFIDVPVHIRYERSLKRGSRGEAELTMSAFEKLDKAHTESELDLVKKDANFVLKNAFTKEELFKELDDVMKKLE